MIEITLVTHLAFILFQDKALIDPSQFGRMHQPKPGADMGCIIVLKGPDPDTIWTKETCAAVQKLIKERE